MSQGLTLEDSAYFDRLAHIDQLHWWPNAMWRVASAWLDQAMVGQTGMKALDVGCGTGNTLSRLGLRDDIARVVGLDPSPEALSHARSRALPLIRANALNLPFPAQQFDLATCFDVFQHLPHGGDRIAAAELYRVVRPGGCALVRANGRGLWPDPATPHALYRLGDLEKVLESAGLKIEKSTYLNCLPAVMAEVVGRFRHSDHAGHPSGGGLQIDVRSSWRNQVMGWISGCEGVVAGKLGGKLPVGHSTLVLARRPSEEGTE